MDLGSGLDMAGGIGGSRLLVEEGAQAKTLVR